MDREKHVKDSRYSAAFRPEELYLLFVFHGMDQDFVPSAQFQKGRIGRFCEWLFLLDSGIMSYLKQRRFGKEEEGKTRSVFSDAFRRPAAERSEGGNTLKEENEMLECDKDEQWREVLSLWVDRKVVTYLKENHSRFEAILSEQSQLAEKYPVITPFLDGEGAMELTAEEHQAIKEYLSLREKTELLLREYHYYLEQAMNIPGMEEFSIHRDRKQEAGENRTSKLLDLLAGNRIEEADQMLRSSNPEYRMRVELEAEAQKVVSNLRKSEKLKHAIANYADAIHGRWLLFTKLFYQYAVEEILSSSREAKEQQDS